MVTQALTLPHGCVALLEMSEDERPAFEVVRAPAAFEVVRAPAGRDRRRRWAHNGHLWQECPCTECEARRRGHVPAGYATVSPDACSRQAE